MITILEIRLYDLVVESLAVMLLVTALVMLWHEMELTVTYLWLATLGILMALVYGSAENIAQHSVGGARTYIFAGAVTLADFALIHLIARTRRISRTLKES